MNLLKVLCILEKQCSCCGECVSVCTCLGVSSQNVRLEGEGEESGCQGLGHLGACILELLPAVQD